MLVKNEPSTKVYRKRVSLIIITIWLASQDVLVVFVMKTALVKEEEGLHKGGLIR